MRAVAVGAARLDAAFDGWVRLPDARLEGCAPPCPETPGQTLQTQGRLTLAGLAPLGSGSRARSSFDGDLQAARFDEAPAPGILSPGVLAGAAAGAVGLVAVGKLLWGLFARNNRPLLEHPKAKAIHDLVQQRPGLSLSGLERALGLGHGTVQYHVKRLLDAGLVVAYSYRNSVRFFENHGRHADDWKEHAALHKPELRRLHQWLTGHPRASQTFILRHTAEWGWKRSTTQHYLKLLQGADLLSIERTPAAVAYTALLPEKSNRSHGRHSLPVGS